MIEDAIDRFLRHAQLCTSRARTHLRHGNPAEARILTAKAKQLLALSQQTRLVRACASLPVQSTQP